MRKLSEAELLAIAVLYAQSQQDREIEQGQKRAIAPLGQPLPVIHQVLFG